MGWSAATTKDTLADIETLTMSPPGAGGPAVHSRSPGARSRKATREHDRRAGTKPTLLADAMPHPPGGSAARLTSVVGEQADSDVTAVLFEGREQHEQQGVQHCLLPGPDVLRA